MPELPDVTTYITALEPRILGQVLERISVASVSLLRSADPPLSAARRRASCRELRRLGKRIAIGLDGDLWLVLHLMIAGRLHWRPVDAKLAGRNQLAAFDFPNGTLVLTEAGSKRRARCISFAAKKRYGRSTPAASTSSPPISRRSDATLTVENHTLKRALTDPRLLSGIGNAYSDEILHAAQLSPIALTHKLSAEEWQRLFEATRVTLQASGSIGCEEKHKMDFPNT